MRPIIPRGFTYTVAEMLSRLKQMEPHYGDFYLVVRVDGGKEHRIESVGFGKPDLDQQEQK